MIYHDYVAAPLYFIPLLEFLDAHDDSMFFHHVDNPFESPKTLLYSPAKHQHIVHHFEEICVVYFLEGMVCESIEHIQTQTRALWIMLKKVSSFL